MYINEFKTMKYIIYCLVDRLGGEVIISDSEFVRAGFIQVSRNEHDTGVMIKTKDSNSL
jgi:hypothetical protein